MATAHLGAESVPVILPHNFSQAAALFARFDRDTIASAVEVLVNLLDVLDGDADREGGWTEDDITDATSRNLRGAFGPGCVMSDAGEYTDEHCD